MERGNTDNYEPPRLDVIGKVEELTQVSDDNCPSIVDDFDTCDDGA